MTNHKKQHSFKTWWQRFGTSKERDVVLENISILMLANVGAADALRTVASEVKTSRLRRLLESIADRVSRGVPFWRACTEVSLFEPAAIALMRIGEESGRLSKNLAVVAAQNKKSRLFKSRIKSAMMYPAFVFGITLFVGVGIAWFILPRLSTVFGQLQTDLPAITRFTIAAGEVLAEKGNIIIPTFLAFLLLSVYVLFFFSKTKFVGQYILLSLPGFKRLISEIEIARFSYLFGTLLQAGLPVSEALASLPETTEVRAYQKLYRHMERAIIKGSSFQRAFSLYPQAEKLFPGSVRQIIVTGEKTGSLSTVLLDISEQYEVKTESTAKDVSVLLEPVLLVIVWAGVLVVALAVILPVYSILGGVR